MQLGLSVPQLLLDARVHLAQIRIRNRNQRMLGTLGFGTYLNRFARRALVLGFTLSG